MIYPEFDSGCRPRDDDAERLLIAGLLFNPGALLEIENNLGSGDFFRPEHSEIFAAISELHRDNAPVSSVSVIDKLKRRGEVSPEFKEMVYEYESFVTSGQSLGHYAAIVQRMGMLRRLADICEGGALAACSGDGDADALHETLLTKLNNVVSAAKTELSNVRDAIKNTYDNIMRRVEDPSSIKCTKTGFADLDAKTGGFKPGELIILAARPAVGKSALALEIARNAANISGLPSIFFTLEMDAESCHQRLLASVGRIPAHLIRNGGLSGEHIARLAEATNELYNTKIAFDDNAAVTVWDIKRKSRAYKHKHGLGLIVIDYLQLMTGNSRDSREREVAEISRQLKILAKELEVPILALSQLNRGLESRQNREPQLSDLRESGAIEQDADVCAFLHKEDNDETNENRGGHEVHSEKIQKVGLILRKNRHGSVGEIQLAWEPGFTRFSNHTEKSAYTGSNTAAIKSAAGW